jgi:CDP-diacylglycerol--glycerol-3-phosphate 3-phosphatidyltransferase
MAEVGLLSTWVVLVIIIREFIISGLRSYAGASGVVISAGPWGKQKLAITVVALVWALLAAYGAVGGSMAALPLGPITLQTIFNLWPIPMALAVFWTIASAVDYLWKSWSLLRNGWSPEAAAEATSTRPVSRKS